MVVCVVYAYNLTQVTITHDAIVVSHRSYGDPPASPSTIQGPPGLTVSPVYA